MIQDNGEVRILVQGITGREAAMVVEHMLAYGAPVLGGVTPGKGGATVHDLPVYDTFWQAQREHAATWSIVYVPPPMVYDACLEALDNGIRNLLVPTEGVPQHDLLRLLAHCQATRARLFGPNTVGIIDPTARLKIGAIGGAEPDRFFKPGRVGVISVSGGMTTETAWMVRRAGYGVSTAISIGGDALIGTPPAALLVDFQRDPKTDAVVLFSEPGTHFDEDVAAVVRENVFRKPLIFTIGGLFTEHLPKGTVFGHSGTLIQRGQDKPSAKQAALAEAGALVAYTYDEMIPLLQQALGDAQKQSGARV